MGREVESHQTLLGYAMDGISIYGHLDADLVLYQCNRFYNDGNHNYWYHVRTLDGDLEYYNRNSPENNWNYILGCYH